MKDSVKDQSIVKTQARAKKIAKSKKKKQPQEKVEKEKKRNENSPLKCLVYKYIHASGVRSSDHCSLKYRRNRFI